MPKAIKVIALTCIVLGAMLNGAQAEGLLKSMSGSSKGEKKATLKQYKLYHGNIEGDLLYYIVNKGTGSIAYFEKINDVTVDKLYSLVLSRGLINQFALPSWDPGIRSEYLFDNVNVIVYQRLQKLSDKSIIIFNYKNNIVLMGTQFQKQNELLDLVKNFCKFIFINNGLKEDGVSVNRILRKVKFRKFLSADMGEAVKFVDEILGKDDKEYIIKNSVESIKPSEIKNWYELMTDLGFDDGGSPIALRLNNEYLLFPPELKLIFVLACYKSYKSTGSIDHGMARQLAVKGFDKLKGAPSAK